jgi:multisubunit Na+/H+ antiporter MnhE subunit
VAVRISSIVLRVAVVLELVLGVSLWIGRPLAPVLLHMALGLLIVALVWFLGLAQATVKGGSLGLTLATFGVGLALAILGLAQGAVPDQPALQIIHVLLALATIAVGEMAVARYRRAKEVLAAAS